MIPRIKESTIEELEIIAREVRDKIIDTCGSNGGHLASSLGVVDLTVALLNTFDIPRDKIIWDVGHQAYAYKILTDRFDRFSGLRKYKGISGFPKRCESPYDVFGTGHGGTSVSAALGLKEAMEKRAKEGKVIAVIGDGAMTSGLALEAMNQIERFGKNLVVVLNDNDMFISTSVGALSQWFSRKLTSPMTSSLRNEIKTMLAKLPSFFQGQKIIDLIKKTIDSSKSLITPGILFEGFGFEYVGPIDGHNLKDLVSTMEEIRENTAPILLHVHTVKGKGYEPAETNPRYFHGVGPFDVATGVPMKTSGPSSFTDTLAEYLPALFTKHDKLVAITAAMPDGTGLSPLQETMPDRVYDVGMAEGHAVTFAAGLAAGGLRPLVAIYSTFLQRAFDSIAHDVALQNLPVIFLVDRAGIVGEDGATHHGIFDIPYMRILPNMTVLAPRDTGELTRMIDHAVHLGTPVSIRYPRGSVAHTYTPAHPADMASGQGEILRDGNSSSCIIGVGAATAIALQAAGQLEKEKIYPSVYDLRFIKPLPDQLFAFLADKHITHITVIEDGIIAGGAGSALIEEAAKQGVTFTWSLLGVNDTFSTHGTQKEIRDIENISVEAVIQSVRKAEK